jgi:hypothetical protein
MTLHLLQNNFVQCATCKLWFWDVYMRSADYQTKAYKCLFDCEPTEDSCDSSVDLTED